jgi:branched-chain amino acid transport system substrate-binding protein
MHAKNEIPLALLPAVAAKLIKRLRSEPGKGEKTMSSQLGTTIRRGAVMAAAFAAMSAVAPAAEPLNIPAVMAQTGSGAFIGTGEKQSLELAEKTINASGGIQGRPVHFVFYDDQSTPQVSVQLVNQILTEKPSVILGSSLVALCRATVPLTKNGPVQYCFSPGLHPASGDYAFTASVSTLDLAKAAIRFLRLKGWTRVAFIFSTDATGQEFEEGMKGVLAEPDNKDMQAVATEHFNITDISVAAQIEKLKAAKPQAFIAWSTGTPIQTIFRAMVQAGLDVPVITTDGNMTYAQMKQYAAFLPNQLYMPAGEFITHDPKIVGPEVAKAQDEFYKVFAAAGLKPDEPSELAWEPAMIVVHALRTLGPQATAQQVHDFIVHLKGFASIDGIYDFEKVPQRGLDLSNSVMTIWSKDAQTWQVVSKPGGEPL